MYNTSMTEPEKFQSERKITKIGSPRKYDSEILATVHTLIAGMERETVFLELTIQAFNM